KTTMISVEMKDGFDNDVYSKQQKILHEKIEQLLSLPEYKNLKLRIDPSQISLDIQPQGAGKHLGAVRIEKWLQENNYKPEKVIMFGDSPSDIEMAEELEDRFLCEFVFVNDSAKLDTKNLTCKVVFTKASFTQGTLEYLSG
ncbi:MAG: HAD family hydrolase, partial [Candidatus Levyibacteriota bacterium]